MNPKGVLDNEQSTQPRLVICNQLGSDCGAYVVVALSR
jgi:hypothetical protein